MMSDIMASVAAPDQSIKLSLQTDLRELATDYLTAALTTPLKISISPPNETLSKRARWVELNLVKPTQRLLNALSDDNAPLRSEWPDPMNAPAPDRAVLLEELRKLYDRADELQHVIADRAPNTNHTQEFKADLIQAITKLFRHYFPHLPITRGVRQKKRFNVFLELCADEIFPGISITDHRVKDVIPRRRKKRTQPKSG
jgi:hypothetical protein